MASNGEISDRPYAKASIFPVVEGLWDLVPGSSLKRLEWSSVKQERQ